MANNNKKADVGDFGHWIKDDTVHGLKPSDSINLVCPYCGTEYQFHSSIIHTGIHDDDFVIGQRYKCPGCDDYNLFEVAVNEEYWNEVNDRRLGTQVIAGDWENQEEIKEKLEALGYW